MSILDLLFRNAKPLPETSSPPQNGGFKLATGLLAAGMAVLFILPCIALVWRALTLSGGPIQLDIQSLVEALSISLSTTAISMLLIVIFGTPMAYLLARADFPFKRVVAVFIELPIVMPPVVAGLALLAAFGRRGLLGGFLELLGIQVPFTTLAVITAQVFVSAPFYIRAAQIRFSAFSQEIEEAARIDGANPWMILRFVTLPLSYRALLAGLALSWARALGEFGATILFAGNLKGFTQTMPLLVYSSLESDLGTTYYSALILLGLAGVMLGVMRWLVRLDDSEAAAAYN